MPTATATVMFCDVDESTSARSGTGAASVEGLVDDRADDATAGSCGGPADG